MPKGKTKKLPAKKVSAKSKKKLSSGFLLTRPNPSTGIALLIGIVGLVVVFAYMVVRYSSASSCTVSSTLVNSCRPLLGAAVTGNPKAASDMKSQVSYYEQSLGRQMDIIHLYNPVGDDTLSADAVYYASRANTYLYQNWKGPTGQWGDVSSTNAGIDSMASSIKQLGSKKIFLTYWHEPENDVSPGGDPSCPNVGYKGNAGSVAQYRAAWSYIENRFNTDGVTNVVWVMDYMGYSAWDCLVPGLWPGNSLVDWVTWDSYSAGDSTTWANTVGRFYNVLTQDNSATANFESKPWGAGEWGDCLTLDQAHVYQYYDEAKAALDAGTYPRMKMYLNFASTIGPGAGLACLTDYSKAGAYDPTEQQYFNSFANDPIFTSESGGATPTPTPTPSPTPVPTPTPTPTPTGKIGDLNNDGSINILDISILLSNWGATNAGIESDLGNNGPVGVVDLSILLSHWGQ
jgi:hypothetical protein